MHFVVLRNYELMHGYYNLKQVI